MAIPTSYGTGVASSTRTFVLNLEEGLMLPVKTPQNFVETYPVTVLMDPDLTVSITPEMSVCMAAAILANCLDVLLLTVREVNISTMNTQHTCISALTRSHMHVPESKQ